MIPAEVPAPTPDHRSAGRRAGAFAETWTGPPLMNSSERRVHDIIQYALAGNLVKAGFSLTVARQALTWVVEQAHRITDLRPHTLLEVAPLMRDYPTDWQDRARAALCGGRDRDISLILPIPRIEPCDPVPQDEFITGTFPDVLAGRNLRRFDAAVLSPPYSGQRSRGKMAGRHVDEVPLYYRSIVEADYPGWMVTMMDEIDKRLNDRGSVIFVLAEHMRDGVWSSYVHDTITALLDVGWRPLVPLFSPWLKRGSAPLRRADRPQVNHEPWFWLTRRKHPYANVKEGGRPSNRIGPLHGWGLMHQPPNKGTRSPLPSENRARVCGTG